MHDTNRTRVRRFVENRIAIRCRREDVHSTELMLMNVKRKKRQLRANEQRQSKRKRSHDLKLPPPLHRPTRCPEGSAKSIWAGELPTTRAPLRNLFARVRLFGPFSWRSSFFGSIQIDEKWNSAVFFAR